MIFKLFWAVVFSVLIMRNLENYPLMWRHSPADTWFCVCACKRGNFFSFLLKFRYLFCVLGHAIGHSLVYNPPVFKGNKYCGRAISITKITTVSLEDL